MRAKPLLTLAAATIAAMLMAGCTSVEAPRPATVAAIQHPHDIGGLRPIMFASGSSYIDPSQYATLDEDARLIRNDPDAVVHVSGFTDSSGIEEGNEWLSKVRADQVAYALEARGVPYYQLITHEFADSHPVASNRTAAGRAQNRRVELVPTDSGEYWAGYADNRL